MDLSVAVVTPEGAAFDGAATSVVAPAHDGQIAFLPGHAPFVGELGAGELRVVAGGATRRWYLEGGVVQVVAGTVVVLADVVRPVEAIDAAAARRDLEAALALRPTDDPSFADRDRRLASARARLRLAAR